jgi:hypothetical protein
MRTITDEQKCEEYRALGVTPETLTFVDSEGVSRPYTEEEWKDTIINFYPHPDLHQKDLSYIGKRREEYPPELDQLNAVWSAIRAIRASGVDIGDTANEMLNTIDKIKQKYPKPDGL